MQFQFQDEILIRVHSVYCWLQSDRSGSKSPRSDSQEPSSLHAAVASVLTFSGLQSLHLPIGIARSCYQEVARTLLTLKPYKEEGVTLWLLSKLQGLREDHATELLSGPVWHLEVAQLVVTDPAAVLGPTLVLHHPRRNWVRLSQHNSKTASRLVLPKRT